EGKTVENASRLLSVLFEDGLTRADPVVAVGGGSLLDLVGFTCAVFGRGIPCYYVPTTLLSQADASVGGKTAVNFGGVKNSVGCFALPAGVMIDVSTLSSLPERQFESGMAEIIKIAAVLDAGLFEMLERGEGDLAEIIKRAVGLKNEIVGLDFRDEGTRRVLNFGHTVGHAVEMAEGLLHGEAICPGMLCMSEGEAKDRLTALISRHGLPTSISTNANALLPLVMKDKKGEGKKINCIICDRIGSYRTEKLDAEEISARIGRITKG
ncbi:MAG: 3-dehydroquinate synthase, partial [Firmicutes bacterium]|nr:3-dehydroquinate synthase [Candidatus Colimorpha enterica]